MRKKKIKSGGPPKVPKKSFLSRFDSLNRFKHWYMGGASLTRSLFRTKAAIQTIGLIMVGLSGVFVVASFYTESGEFVINLDSEMSEAGFAISNNQDFTQGLITLSGSAVIEANNINVFDVSRDVAEIDGEHNGNNYVAYTFYIHNGSKEVRDYQYSLQIRGKEKGAENAIWVMVYQNGKQVTYAMNGKDGPEHQYSLFEFPFAADAKEPEKQYLKVDKSEIKDKDVSGIFSSDKIYKMVTTPFKNESVICEDVRKEMDSGGVDKYTVVIWYEGEDPECTDDILGGWVELYMKFSF